MAGRFSIETVWKASDKLTAPVTKMQNRIGKFTRSVEKNFRRADRMAGKFLKTLGKSMKTAVKLGTAGLGAATAAVTLFTREYSKIEDAEAAFTPLMRGAEKAKKMVEALNETAATTPFQLENLTKSAKILLPGMDGNIQKTVKTLRMLGDMAGGSAENLEAMATAYGRIMMGGVALGQEVDMFQDRGVPLMKEMGEILGINNMLRLKKFRESGKLTSATFLKALQNMTSEGGLFFKGMEIASKTTTGLFSTFRDNVSLTAAAIGEILSPVVKELIVGATEVAKSVKIWVSNNRELIDEKFLEFVNATENAVKNLYETMKSGEAQKSFEKVKKVLSIVGDAIIWLRDHGSTIAKITALVTGLAVAVKGVSLAIAAIGAVATAPVWAIHTAFAALLAVIVKVASKSEKVMQLFDKVKTGISTGLTTVEEALPEGLTARRKSTKRSRTTFSPSVRAVESLKETRTLDRTEVTIKDETGRAEVTKRGNGNNFNLAVAGGF